MGIILGVIQAFLNSVGMILTKKVLENKAVGNNIQTLFSKFNHFAIIILLMIFGFFSFEISNVGFTSFDIFLILVSTTGLYLTYPLRRTAYANEKISTLQPFAMMFQVFPVILGFIFIASERANFITFLFAILASFIVIVPSIDLKTFKINKYSLMVLIGSVIKSCQLFATIYFLTKLNAINFYLLETTILVIISLMLIVIKGEFQQFKLLKSKYLKLLTYANFVSVVAILLSLSLLSALGVVVTSLLSLLYLVFVYTLGYYFLGEKPTKKDLIITVLVLLCVIFGMYFEN